MFSVRVVIIALLACVWVLIAQTKAPPADGLIVPGVRVGPVTKQSTEASLVRQFGPSAAAREVDITIDGRERATVFYNQDPKRKLIVVWNEESPSHPSRVYLCHGLSENTCVWRTVRGIRENLTIKELERRNKRAFSMTTWGPEDGGWVISWEGGNLEAELQGVSIRLIPREDSQGNFLPRLTKDETDFASLEGVRSSANPIIQKLNPRVGSIIVKF